MTPAPASNPQSPNESSVASDTERQRTGPLEGSLRGLLHPKPELYLLSNCYTGKQWGDGGSMELDNKKDIARVQNWASAGIPQILAYTNNNTVIKVMEKILRRQCGQAPTILYIGGHTMLIKGKDTYITADCEEEQPVPDRGVSFQRMRSLLLSNRETNPLLIITDACAFTNFLALPFEFCPDGGRGHWKRTKYYTPNGWDKNQKVLHIASSSPEEASNEFKSRGGLFTSEFCRVPLVEELTIGERFARIQQGIDEFLAEYSMKYTELTCPLTQQLQMYSSYEFDLYDNHILQSLGFRPLVK